MDEPRDPSLETLLELHGDVVKSGINTSLPGRIVSYDSDTRLAVVQPLIRARYLDEDGETQVVRDLPPVHDCPVKMFGNTGRGGITIPVAAGDLCELSFSATSLAAFIRSAGSNTVDPADDRRHDLTDATCWVGLSTSKPPSDAPTDAVVVHVGGGITIKLGDSGADDGVVRKSDLDALVTGLDARIAVLTAGLPATATELATVQAIRDALPPGWPTASSTTFTR